MTASVSHPTPCSPDAAALAAAVRDLARIAHRTLHDPSTSPAELRELSRRVAHLQAGLTASSAVNPLANWLESLSRKVEVRERIARPAQPLRRGEPLTCCWR
jgi:hypothetical protein